MSDIQEQAKLAPAARVGAELRAARQSYGWELPDLAASLRIRQPFLEAIEAGKIADLPGTTYALGFVRTYAKALGLPAEDIANRFRNANADVIIRPELTFPAPVPSGGVPAGALMLLGLLILGGAYGGWYYLSEHPHVMARTVPPVPERFQPPKPILPSPSPQVASILPGAAPPTQHEASAPVKLDPIPQPEAPKPAQPAEAQPLPPPGGPPPPPASRIVIKATADAWVTVKPAGGTPVMSRLMHAGDSWPVPPDQANLYLTTGNAGGTEIDVDGTAIPPLGTQGMVRRDLPLAADMLKSGKIPPLPHAKPAASQPEATPASPAVNH